MNHNFLPYDICEMLPKENTYSHLGWWVEDDKYDTELNCFVPSAKLVYKKPISKKGLFLYDENGNSEDVFIRDAWTIIDCLTYLENKGFIIECDYLLDSKYWQYTIISTNHFIVKDKFQTRIEAYTEGIKHCLLLINDQSDK